MGVLWEHHKEAAIMPEARLSVRVDKDIKQRAENVFNELGLTMSSGINLYLNRVVAQRGIPFPLMQIPQDKRHSDMGLRKQIEELRAQRTIESRIKGMLDRGVAVALFDDQLNRPYLQYPDGRRAYDIDE